VSSQRSGERRNSVPAVRASKRRDGALPLTMVTAYDEPMARLADLGGVDMLLVGDSVANVVLGYEDTLQVTIEVMAHHTAAVARAKPEALIVGDLPWMSYHVTTEEAVRSAARLIRAGAQCVKLEGGASRVPVVEAIINAEIPVMGHVGLTPQSMHAMGGFRVQGRTVAEADHLLESVAALEAAGCFAVVVEGVPDALGTGVTEAAGIPTIGIGAGSGTDGQVLVLHDLLGMGAHRPPKFVRRYAEVGEAITAAVGAYVDDVRAGRFPGPDESYGASEALREHLEG
jgi:3-methyl-2-oxobutanoate hydroxymethyltransferase